MLSAVQMHDVEIGNQVCDGLYHLGLWKRTCCCIHNNGLLNDAFLRTYHTATQCMTHIQERPAGWNQGGPDVARGRTGTKLPCP